MSPRQTASRVAPSEASPGSDASTGARRQGKRQAAVRRHVPSDQRRAQILHAAAGLFAQSGFAGTTTRGIADAVGSSETVLFRLFPTKERLYLAVLEHEVPSSGIESWLAELRAIAATRDDDALFRAIVSAVLASYRANPVYHRLMLFAALEHQELARAWQVRYMTPLASFLREYVSQRQSEGAFAGGRPEVVVHMLLGMTAHFGLWNLLGINPFGLTEREIAAQAAAMIHGLRGPVPRAAAPEHPRAGSRKK